MDLEWNKNAEFRQKLYVGGAQEVLGSLPKIMEAFQTNPERKSILCIDEGCSGAGVHLAGSGCGIKEEDLILELKAAGVTEFTVHENCGAWGLAHPEIIDPKAKEEAVQEWGKQIAAKTGLPFRYIKAEDMNRPADFHSAFYAFYDQTGRFNMESIKEVPTGFITTPRYFPSAKSDLALAAKIAIGNHGFGSRFNQENPFVLVGIVNIEDQTTSKEAIIQDLQEIQKSFEPGLVKIDVLEVSIPAIV